MLSDSDGITIARGLTYAGAQALREEWLANYSVSGGGVTLLIKPNEPIADVPPIQAHFQTIPSHFENRAIGLPAIPAGSERDHLRECVAMRGEHSKTLNAAEIDAMRAREHLADLERDVARLRAADEAETAAAGALLAARIKAGQPTPLEPSLRTGRNALLEAEARRDAGGEACALLNADVAAARQALAVADQAVERAVDAVIHAELQGMVEMLKELWQKILPLKLTIDGARYVGFPPSLEALEVLQSPELPTNAGSPYIERLANYRRELLRNADAVLEVQSERVIA